MRYGLAPAIIGGGMLASYLIRIAVEEKALADGIGEPYRAYMRRTKRLIPVIRPVAADISTKLPSA